jgi:hypothetical protein
LMVGDCDVDFNIETNFTANQALSDALPASCALPASNAWRDAWATFTATSNNTSVEYTQAAGATTDIQIEIFRGTCGSLTRVAVWNKSDQCADAVPVNTAGDENINSLQYRVLSTSFASSTCTPIL